MKSKIFLTITSLSLCLAGVTQADESIEPQVLNTNASMPQLSRDVQVQSTSYIQPCYRWPHPCD